MALTNTATKTWVANERITAAGLNSMPTISGDLPVTQLNGGTSASASTYWRGDGAWVAPVICARATAQLDKTDTTFTNVTGLSATLVAGATYSFDGVLFATHAAGGGKVRLDGTATVTAIAGDVSWTQISTNARTDSYRGSGTLNGTTGKDTTGSAQSVQWNVRGSIVVNAGGTVTVQFAQNSASGTSSLLVGSYIVFTRH